MIMETQTYVNRYNDEYKFTPDKDGNLLWEGDFKWCRYGMPNDYTKSYLQYLEDGEPLGFMDRDTFEERIHENFHDETDPMKKYVMLVESRTDKISMVDPSGGPYISTGMSVGIFHSDMRGKKVVDIEPIETGYKLILKPVSGE